MPYSKNVIGLFGYLRDLCRSFRFEGMLINF